eukprot:TRINITY_DN4780_c0_g2_i4.p1 TRINITY_DN4780_c0_g2~~TRINITY_DN4780_c0_g2_i4.p1  ORF type:complete len:314 (-),score=64.74 TRINITY_DN4780_c0_g2_i4:627-1568(-)
MHQMHSNNNQMMNNCNAEDRQLVDEKKDQDEDDEAGQLESTIAIRIDQIAEICNLYVQSHQGVSLVLFVDGICNEIFKLYSELRTRPLTFLTTSPTRRSSASGRRFDWSWNAGCDLLLFILGSSTYFGGVKSSLKPFPEFDRIEDCPWVGSPSDIHEVVQAVSRLQSCQIRESRDLLKLDRTTQWLPLWVEKYQNVVLKLKLLDRPDPRVNAGAWKAPDYQFDAELLPDPHFDALCQKNSKIIAYHGSPTGNWYSIIRNGLEIRSWTSQMKHGAILAGDCKMANCTVKLKEVGASVLSERSLRALEFMKLMNV